MYHGWNSLGLCFQVFKSKYSRTAFTDGLYRLKSQEELCQYGQMSDNLFYYGNDLSVRVWLEIMSWEWKALRTPVTSDLCSSCRCRKGAYIGGACAVWSFIIKWSSGVELGVLGALWLGVRFGNLNLLLDSLWPAELGRGLLLTWVHCILFSVSGFMEFLVIILLELMPGTP